MKKYNIVVFVSGFISMGFEMVAGYIMRPIFGGSMFTWGSIIGSVLLGLSVGYMVGGKLSESDVISRTTILLYLYPILITVIFISGFFGVQIAPILSLTDTYIEPLLPAIILFGTPSFLFGIVNPIIISMRVEDKGEASGLTFSYSTIGSIFGVFLTTFYLIPFHGLNKTISLFIFILLLLLVYIKVYISDKKLVTPFFILISGITIILIISVISISFIFSPSGDVVHQEQSKYKTINIVDNNNNRYMVFGDPYNNLRQASINKTDRKKLNFRYTQYSLYPFILDNNDINKTLIVGGGGYIIPRAISRISNNKTNIDVVEHDQKVYEIAQEYMYYQPDKYDNINNIIEDGRVYIEKTDKKYDYILLDAYNANSVPSHMTTKEFYESVKFSLEDDGYLSMQIIQKGDKDLFYRSTYKTLKSVFPKHEFYIFEKDSTKFLVITQNKIEKKSLLNNAEYLNYNISNSMNDFSKMNNIKTNDVIVITDNRNPSDIYSEK